MGRPVCIGVFPTNVKSQRLLLCAGLLAFFVVCVCNIHWIEYRFLNGAVAAFTFSPGMMILCAVVLLAVGFQERLEQWFYAWDGRMFGRREESYTPLGTTVRYERLFLWMAMIAGVLFVFLIPPMAAPDETNHFTRAYLLAHGEWMPVVDASKRAVGKVGTDLRDFLSVWNASASDPNHKVSLQTWTGLLKATVSGGADTVSVDYPYPYLSFFLYIPQAFGIAVGSLLFRLFHASDHYNIYLQLLFARLANLSVFVALIGLSIKTVPFFKRTLTLLALMPMAVFIAASCSYDVFLYGVCFLYLAYVLKCAYDPTVTEIGGKQLFILILLQFCILLGKYVYFPLLLLIFLIPREKFHGQPARKIVMATVFPSGLCLSIWLIAYKISVVGLAADPYSPVYRQQAQFVLFHPVRYAVMLLDNLYQYRKDWLTGFVGLFGWLNVPLPWAFVLLYVIVLLVSSVLETVINRTFLSRRLLGLVSLACYILVATAEYVVWTPSLGNGKVGQLLIIGVQGRYFIPFAFPILLLLANKLTYRTYLFGKLDAGMHRAAGFLSAGSLAFALLFLLKCYWLA